MSGPHFCWVCGAPAVERELDHAVRRVCTRCGKVLYRNPVPAGGCIVDHNGAVVLALRKFEPWKGFWYVPSGFVEYGEDVEETARREVREETGLHVALGRVFGVYSYFDDPRQHGIIILYLAAIVGGSLQAGDDAADVAYFAADALPPVDQIAFASHRRALREWSDEVLYARLSSRVEHPGAQLRASPHHGSDR